MSEELNQLKQQADTMGIKYHPSIGVDALRDKISDHLNDTPKNEPNVAKPPVNEAKLKNDRLNRKRRDAAKLIRISLTCMNPNKKDWDGEIITAGNSTVGFFKKFVPYNAQEAGYHVPNIIYKALLERQCPIYVSTKLANGMKSRKQKLIKEYAIELLDPLNDKELADLKKVQQSRKA